MELVDIIGVLIPLYLLSNTRFLNVIFKDMIPLYYDLWRTGELDFYKGWVWGGELNFNHLKFGEIENSLGPAKIVGINDYKAKFIYLSNFFEEQDLSVESEKNLGVDRRFYCSKTINVRVGNKSYPILPTQQEVDDFGLIAIEKYGEQKGKVIQTLLILAYLDSIDKGDQDLAPDAILYRNGIRK